MVLLWEPNVYSRLSGTPGVSYEVTYRVLTLVPGNEMLWCGHSIETLWQYFC